MTAPITDIKRHVHGVASSATLAINEQSNALRAQGRTIYKLGLGQSPFPVPESVVAALKEHAREKDYLPVRGLPELRAAVAGYHNRQSGLDYRAEDILIAPGSKELLYILQLVFNGTIVLPSPSWVTYAPQAQLFGNRVLWIETTPGQHWKLLPAALDAACREDGTGPKLLVLNYPSNPTGFSFTDGELEELANVVRTHQMVVLSDEIYGELHHEGSHRSIATYYPEGTIVSAGLSKWCGAGGWRLGTFAFPAGMQYLLNAMAVVASETFTATSAPIQHAAVTAFRKGERIDRYIAYAREILRVLAEPIVERLSKVGANVSKPDGAFYLFPSFEKHARAFDESGVHTSAEFSSRLLQDTGVAVLPGSAFGRPAAELSVRLAYVDFDGAAALEAASRQPVDEALVTRCCGNVLAAVDLLCEWIEQTAA